MNVLAIAPHPDDEAIGCGGALCLHADRGDKVCAAFLTSGEMGLKHLPREEAWHIRESEAASASEVLGIARLAFLRCPDWFLGENVSAAAAALRPILEQEQPDVIYLPHPAEWHPDHKAASQVVLDALHALGQPMPRLRAYEVWTPLTEWSEVEDISAVIGRKVQAVRCYHSQLRAFRYDRVARGLGAYRGALATRTRFAEVFGEIDVHGVDANMGVT